MKDLFTIPKAEICKISCHDVVYTSVDGFDTGNMGGDGNGTEEPD